MKSDMAGIQMCREGSKIWNRAHPGPGLESIKMGIYINFDAEKEVWYYTEDRKGDKRTRSILMKKRWLPAPKLVYQSYPSACLQDRRSGDRQFIPISILCHLIVIGLPCVRVEIFRTGTNPIVEGYGSVHLRDSKRWEDRKEWAPRGSAWQRVPRFLLQSLSCALPPGGSRTGRALVDLQGKRG